MQKTLTYKLVLTYEWPPLGGGGGVIAYNLAQQWASKGEQLIVITTWFNELPEFEEANGIKIYRIKSRRKFRYKSNPLEMLSWIYHAKQQVKSLLQQGINFEFTIAHFVRPGGDVALWLKQRYDIPFAVISHGHDIPWVHAKRMWPLYVLSFFKIKAVLLTANRIGVQTEMMRQNLFAFLGEGKAKHHFVLPNGFNSELFYPEKKSNGPVQVIFAARLVHQKNPMLLFKALEKLSHLSAEFELNIYGDGPLRPDLEQYARHQLKAFSIKFLGKVEQGEMAQKLRLAHIFVQSSANEGMSLSMIEAAACGCKVIVTPVSGVEELRQFYPQIAVVPQNNEQQLAKVLAEAIQHTVRTVSNETLKPLHWSVIAAQYLENLKP